MTLFIEKIYRKFLKREKRKNKRFSFWKLNKMRKTIEKLYCATLCSQIYKNPNLQFIQELQVYPEDFKTLSNEQIERGLNLMVDKQDIISWRPNKLNNADGYLLIFPLENRSQERFSKVKTSKLERIPQEINIDTLNLEPINQKQAEANVYTTSAEQSQQQTQVDSTIPTDEEQSSVEEPENMPKPTKHTSIWDN